MALNGSSVLENIYHFDHTGDTTEWTDAAAGATGAVSYSAGGSKGVSLAVSDAADSAWIHFGDKLVFDIDELLEVEFLYQISGSEAGTEMYLGLISAFNATPSSIAAAVLWKISGATAALAIETDDGTIDNNDIATTLTVSANEVHRATINFATGIQTVSPPSASTGGKTSIQFTHTDTSQVQHHINQHLSQHISMANYSGGLQLAAGARQVGSNASATPTLFVKRISVKSRPLG